MPHNYNLRNKNEAQFKSLLQDILPSKHMNKKKEESSDSESDSSEYETESESDVNVNITFTIKADESEYTDSDSESEFETETESEPENLVKTDEFIKKVQSIGSELSDMYKELPIFKEFMKTQKEMEKKQESAKLNAEKTNRTKNETKFDKLISNKQMSDAKYFAGLSTEEQTSVLSKLTVLHSLHKCQKPSRIQILESAIPDDYKIIALHKVAQLKQGSDGEIGKNKAWLDGFMKLPFGVYHSLPVTLSDGTEKCHAFMEHAKQCLDQCTYGLNDAKMQIMQYIGQLISNPIGAGTVIAIEGPMGTGKTTLVKEGISVILQRPFSFIALGGATDSSTLEGHMITYEGSVWGQIADILMRSKCMNPVIYFDELDKVSDTPKGEEIIGILTHLTDSSQNAHFEDKYFMGIGLDLSRATLVFSYNDRSKVNSILKDRMNVIKTEGYTSAQKSVIAKQYLSKSIRQNISFQPEDVIITDSALTYIIENYTGREKGVRNLKRCLETIYAKLNLFRLMTPGTNLFEEDLSMKVEFPFTVTPDIVRKLLKIDEPKSELMMYL
jgi:ATP-dependent Lon protease